jgi:3-phenylpropionate/trans-cinnamate dioxygenase ferredoxin reductase component
MADGDLIIVGASLAGAKAAEGARKNGWSGPIRLIGAESHKPYERPPLSKAVLAGKDEPDKARVHDDAFYETNDIDLVLGSEATRLDTAAHEVELANGRGLPYGKVVLATGSSPRKIAIPGVDLPEVMYLRSVDDSLQLRERLSQGARLAVVGASWIGTEAAASARQRGAEVVMIDPLSQPLERVLGVEVGRYFAKLHADRGVQLKLSVGVEAIEGDGHVSSVRLADGSSVEADLVLVGIGVTPNIELARQAGLSVNQGVLVDQYLQSSDPDVYVAGDIAEEDHPVLGQRVRVEHWANALNQGLTAGANVAGAQQSYDRIPYFFSDQYDTGMEYSGWPVPYDEVLFRGNPDDGAFVAFYLAGDKVVGGANVNVWDVNEHVQALIRGGRPADRAKLSDPNTDPADWSKGG